MTPLLSIIVPTKNRQYTAVFAVESVLNIPSNKIEVVIQDCSSDRSLEEMLSSKFPQDERVRYFHSGFDTISLTQNWNLAIANTRGNYICGIGDDDAVMPCCCEVAEWMEQNQVETVLGPSISYIWKDAYIGSFSNSRLTYSTGYTGDIFEVDLETEFNKKALNCGFGYTEGLPNLYHGIVKKALFDLHKSKTGHYLEATSFDVYNSFILPAYTRSFCYIDYPITIRGVSGKSNANRIISKKFLAHFQEFKHLHIPDILPRTLNAEVSIGESTIVALQDTGRDDLIAKLRFSIVFAKCAANDLLHAYRFYSHYRAVSNAYNSKTDFFLLFMKFLKARCRNAVLNIALKIFYKLIPQADKIIEQRKGKKKLIVDDILLAVKTLEEDLALKQLHIQYTAEHRRMDIKKEVWD